MRFDRIEKHHLERAKEHFETLRDTFLTEVLTPRRVIDGAAILMKHIPEGRVLDVGTGQAEVLTVLARESRYDCFGCDDFQDLWHGDVGPEKLVDHMRSQGVTGTHVEDASHKLPYDDAFFDGVFCCNMIEHLHHTPRFLMDEIHRVLKPGGIVAIGMPNSVNLRKRIAVLRGRTNYVALDVFSNDGLDYRGHVREFTPREVWTMLECGSFRPLVTYMLDWQVNARLAGFPLRLYRLVSPLLRTARDSYIVVGRKPT